MLTAIAIATVLLSAQAGAQPVNRACSVLGAQDVQALVGAGAHHMSISTAPGASSCMFQNGDAVITVLLSKQDSADAASRLFASKQRIVAGQDVTGWATKAYAGALTDAAAVGLLKGPAFLEVRLSTKGVPVADLQKKLRGVMQEIADHF